MDIAIYKKAGGEPPVETKAESPTIAPASKSVTEATVNVTITPAASTEVYYTTNGDDPVTTGATETNLKYSAPFDVTATAGGVTVKAIAKDTSGGGLEDSGIVSATYKLVEQSTIAQARAAAAGTTVCTEGVVSYIDSQNIYIQEISGTGDAGIVVRYKAKPSAPPAIGQAIEVIGTIDSYNDRNQISAAEADVTKGATGQTFPAPTATTIAAIKAGGDTITPMEFTRIKLSGATVTDINTSNPTYNITLTQGSDTLQIYKCPPTNALENFMVGSTVDVITVLEPTSTGYRLRVASTDDFSNISAPDKVATPTAIPSSGNVYPESEITFATTTTGATIQYKVGEAEYVTGSSYTVPADAVVGTTITIKVKATKDTVTPSDEAAFTYTVAEKPIVTDPIPDNHEVFTGDVKNIKQVLELKPGTDGLPVSLVGQIVYRSSYADGGQEATLIQDVIDGTTYSMYVYKGALAETTYHIGDVVKVTGKYKIYFDLPEIDTGSTAELVTPIITADPLPPVVYDNIADLTALEKGAVNSYIKLNNVTIGKTTTNSEGKNPTTTITDTAGKTIQIYNAASFPQGVGEGSKINVNAIVGINRSVLQLRTGTPELNDGATIYEFDDETPPVITIPDQWYSAERGKPYTVSLEISDYKMASAAITYKVNNGAPTTAEMGKSSGTGKWEYTIPAAVITEKGSITFTVKATDAKGNHVTCAEQTVAITDLPRVVSALPNAPTLDNKTPEFAVIIENGGNEAPTVNLSLANQDGTVVIDNQAMAVTAQDTSWKAALTPDTTLADGRYTAKVSVTRTDSAAANHTWAVTIGAASYTAYFGQLHAHTAEYSDGSGTLAGQLTHLGQIPDANNVDFSSYTDHSNYFDTTGAPNPAAALHDTAQMTADSKAKWDKYNGAVNDFNALNNGKTALSGFEMTWSGGPGHINTFNTPGIVSRNNKDLNSKTGDAGMRAYYDLLKNEALADSINQFNHPGKTFGTFADFAYWDPAIDSRIQLIEVGNGEGAIGSSGYFPSYNEYTKALDKGWHLAPTNNQDNHRSPAGDANDARTVILTEAGGGKEALLQGMRDMTMYTTEDKNLEIMYTVNDQIMGSIIPEKPTAPLNFYFSATDTENDKISKAEIVVNGGRVAHSFTDLNSANVTKTFTLAPDYSYYFLRITQADGNIAVTAPVWVGATPKVGVTDVTMETVMPLQGDKLTFETSLYNYETSPLTVTEVKYSLTHLGKTTVLDTIANPVTVAPNTDVSTLSFLYTADKLGKLTLTVNLEATLGDKPFSFERNVEFEVLDPDSVVPIAIDGGHSNFYITGNYPNSDAGLIEMCSRSGIQVTRLAKGELTYDKIKDMALVVLTVPFKEFGAAVSDHLYTQSELDALTRYANEGGNFIITSKSDRGDPAADNEHASAITNGILSAVGAKARVAEGIVVDVDKASNESYRITLGGESEEDLKCFNYAAMGSNELAATFLKDVQTTTNNTFSAYNSAPILPNGATTLVSGFPATTWGTNYSDLLGSEEKYAPKPDATEVTPKGGTHLITAETLPGGGFAIVSGVTFFSTFEVKVELDFVGQLQNSNYQIVQNILDTVKPEPVISKIEDVQAAPEGERFVIEGIATSNASGFDQATAFFDCIYLQDSTAGINIFPVASDIQAGQTLRITGYTSSYQGERQLAASNVEVIDSTVKPLPSPKPVTPVQAQAGAHLGSLVTLTGRVSRIDTVGDPASPQTIMVRGEDGYEARVFIDNYITSSKAIANLAVGANITATGLSSFDNSVKDIPTRIRIRDRADITCTPNNDPLPKPLSSAEFGSPTLNFVDWAGAGDGAFMIDGVTINRADMSGKVTVIGELAYKEGFTGFWPDNTAMQSGHFLGIRLTLPTAGTSLAPAIRFGEKTVTAHDGIDANGNRYFDFIQRLDALETKSFTFIVDLDGAGADNYQENTYTVDFSGLTLTPKKDEPTPSSPSGGGSSNTVRPSDVKESADSVTVKLPSAGAKLNKEANEKVIASNEKKPVILTGGGLSVTIPAGTLKAGADVNAMLVNPKDKGNVIQVTHADGSASILPFSIVGGGNAAYIAKLAGTYKIIDNTKTFPDVAASHWASDAISFATSHELFLGQGDGSFGPAVPMTRSMLVTVLARMDSAVLGSAGSFTDVPDDAWYAKEVAWAAGHKLVEGSGGSFSPDAPVSREQLCAILVRYMKYAGITLAETGTTDGLSDMSSVSPWASDAVTTALKTGLLTGKTGGLIDPQGQASRAEIATILQRFITYTLK